MSDKGVEGEERRKLLDAAHNLAFEEAVRQVSVQCLDRGSVLASAYLHLK